MPGIVGLITRIGRERAEPQLQRMVRALLHEPFYESGTWIDESAGIYVGWVARREASLGLTPIEDDRRSKVLIFSGEEFSDPSAHYFFQKNGNNPGARDGSYILDLAEKGTEFPANLNGRFHGLLFDRLSGESILFNDRYGMHRLYHHQSPDAFYFAAESKAILAVRPELRAIDLKGLGELVSCGCVLENRTLFRNIGAMPPGSAWSFRNGAIERRGCYFDPKEWEEQGSLDLETYYEQLRDIFSRNIPKYFGGKETVAVSLTGGLDSRMIMAWLRASAGTVPCFSFGGPVRDCQDVTVAQQVAKLCGQQHQTIRVADEFLAQFPRLAERAVFLTDATVDVRGSCDLYINERARRIAPVRMTGNYGGEVLRSIRAFKPSNLLPGLFGGELSTSIAEAKQTYASLIDVHPLSFSAFRQAPWHHYGLQALEQTQVALRSPYLDNDLVKTVFRAPFSTLGSDDISMRLIQDGNPGLFRLRTDRGLAGNSGKLLTRIRHEYQEFTFKAEYAYDYGMPQWVARTDNAFSALHLERLFLGRHKFTHFRIWYRDALAGYVREMLLDSRTLSRPYLNRKAVEEVVAGHLKGGRNYTTAIHKIMTLEHLHRLFVDA